MNYEAVHWLLRFGDFFWNNRSSSSSSGYFNPGTVFITAAILFLGYTAQKQNGGRDENCAGIKVPNVWVESSYEYVPLQIYKKTTVLEPLYLKSFQWM